MMDNVLLKERYEKVVELNLKRHKAGRQMTGSFNETQ